MNRLTFALLKILLSTTNSSTNMFKQVQVQSYQEASDCYKQVTRLLFNSLLNTKEYGTNTWVKYCWERSRNCPSNQFYTHIFSLKDFHQTHIQNLNPYFAKIPSKIMFKLSKTFKVKPGTWKGSKNWTENIKNGQKSNAAPYHSKTLIPKREAS